MTTAAMPITGHFQFIDVPPSCGMPATAPRGRPCDPTPRCRRQRVIKLPIVAAVQEELLGGEASRRALGRGGVGKVVCKWSRQGSAIAAHGSEMVPGGAAS